MAGTIKELKNTWLVQRLNKPHEGKMGKLLSTFAFGGGLKNGGLSEGIIKMLAPYFSFDYMGSAEFEYGAVPECFRRIAKDIKDYSAWEFVNVLPAYVYIIGRTEQRKQIQVRIKEIATNKCRLKESSCFDVALGLSEYFQKEKCRTIGWLELDNDFMFFTDSDAYLGTAELFGLIGKEK